MLNTREVLSHKIDFISGGYIKAPDRYSHRSNHSTMLYISWVMFAMHGRDVLRALQDPPAPLSSFDR